MKLKLGKKSLKLAVKREIEGVWWTRNKPMPRSMKTSFPGYVKKKKRGQKEYLSTKGEREKNIGENDYPSKIQSLKGKRQAETKWKGTTKRNVNILLPRGQAVRLYKQKQKLIIPIQPAKTQPKKKHRVGAHLKQKVRHVGAGTDENGRKQHHDRRNAAEESLGREGKSLLGGVPTWGKRLKKIEKKGKQKGSVRQ